MANTEHAPSLKAQNSKALWLLVGGDIVVVILVLTGFAFTQASLTELAQSALARGILLAAAGPLVAVFLNDLLPSGAKASIVFWRLTDVLPGHRAFSHHAPADPRIDLVALKGKVGEFPKTPRDQNTMWYRLYLTHVSSVSVSDAHKRFLLFRDAASLTLLIFVFTGIAIAFAGIPTSLKATLLGGLLIQFMWLALSARNNGVRLVQNVLALEAAGHGKKKK